MALASKSEGTGMLNLEEDADSPRLVPLRVLSPVHRKVKFGIEMPISDVLNEQPVRSRSSSQYISNGVTCISQWRVRMHTVLRSHQFNTGVGILITLNTLCMGLELDQHDMAAGSDHMFSFSSVHQGIPRGVFDGFEAFFFTAFAVELLIRIFVFRSRLIWEVSTYIDVVALLPAVMLLALGLQSGKQLTLLRIVRLVKLFRLLRIFRLSKELNMLAKSMASAMRALVWIALLLFITVYCSAIVCTTVIGQSPSFGDTDPVIMAYEAATGRIVDSRRYWGSLMRSMLTLFQIFTLDDWNAAVRPVVETHQPWMLVFFISFIFVTTFGLLNLLMGTIVDRAMHIAKEYEEEKERLVQCEQKQMLLATVRLFSLMDQDGNGMISAREIMAFLESNDIQKALEQEMSQFHIKLDYASLMEICRRIADEWFDASSPDLDGITVEEFAGAASRLQGLARSQDMLTVLMTSKASLTRVEMCESSLHKLWEASERQEAKMDKVLEALGNHEDSASKPNLRKEIHSMPQFGRQQYETERTETTCSFRDNCDAESSRNLSDSVIRSNTEPVLPLVYIGDSHDDGKFDFERHETIDGVRNNMPNLGLDRRVCRRAGSSYMQGLLKDLGGFDEFIKTETATAIREYSTRTRGEQGDKSATQGESSSKPTADSWKGRRRASDSDVSLHSTSSKYEKMSAWSTRRRSVESSTLSESARASAQKEKAEGVPKSQASRSVLSHGAHGIDEPCNSILPCAIPFSIHNSEERVCK